MKTSTAYLLIAFFSATHVSAECIEGTRQEISPGYVVEHKCGIYRQGGAAIKNINSEAECAALARDAGVDIATYYAPRKQCIIAKEGGKDLPYPGATYLQRVEENDDPFEDEQLIEDDPFGQTCEEEKETLKADLDKCHADLALATKKPTCGVAKWGGKWYDRKNGLTLAQCKQACDADVRCLSYSANKGTSGAINCYLYDKETSEVPDGTYPNFVQYDKRCA
ncbi:hypothetical protein FOVSG1_005317 [Fusarium oxysporum f. sp. vasinfectum]